jgi:hypothetical protein
MKRKRESENSTGGKILVIALGSLFALGGGVGIYYQIVQPEKPR